jgi:hypothetical protein
MGGGHAAAILQARAGLLNGKRYAYGLPPHSGGHLRRYRSGPGRSGNHLRNLSTPGQANGQTGPHGGADEKTDRGDSVVQHQLFAFEAVGQLHVQGLRRFIVRPAIGVAEILGIRFPGNPVHDHG